MQNARNGVDPSMGPPQGMMGHMMHMPLDVMPLPPMESPRPGPFPITTLASALASASPEQQRFVCFTDYELFSHLLFASSFIIQFLAPYVLCRCLVSSYFL